MQIHSLFTSTQPLVADAAEGACRTPEAADAGARPLSPNELVRLTVRLGWTVTDAYRHARTARATPEHVAEHVASSPRPPEPVPPAAPEQPVADLSTRSLSAAAAVAGELALVRRLVDELSSELGGQRPAGIADTGTAAADIAGLDADLRQWIFVAHDDDLRVAYQLGADVSDLVGSHGTPVGEWRERLDRIDRAAEHLAAAMGPGSARALHLVTSGLRDDLTKHGPQDVVRLGLEPGSGDEWRRILLGGRASVTWLQESVVAQLVVAGRRLVVTVLLVAAVLLVAVLVAAVWFALDPATFSAPDAAWYTRLGAGLAGAGGLVSSAWRTARGPVARWFDDWRLGALQASRLEGSPVVVSRDGAPTGRPSTSAVRLLPRAPHVT